MVRVHLIKILLLLNSHVFKNTDVLKFLFGGEDGEGRARKFGLDDEQWREEMKVFTNVVLD